MFRLILGCLLLLAPGTLARAAPNHPLQDPEVRACLESVVAHPDSVPLAVALIDAYRKIDTIDSRRLAAQVYTKLLKTRPSDVPLLIPYAQLRMDQGFFGEAERAFRKAARLEPGSVAASFGMAQLALNDYRRYLDTKRLRIANGCLDRVLELDPAHRDALFFRTFTHLVAGETTLARVAIERLVQAHPDDAWGYLLLGTVAQGSRRYAEAQQAMDRAAQLVRAPDEKAAFETLHFVGYRAEEVRETLDVAAAGRLTRDFWKRIDPTPATGRNERWLEHLRRIVLAELYYGVAAKHIRGWNTAPGEAIIRFGPPVSRSPAAGRMALHMPGWTPPAMHQVHEIDGEDVEFTFEDRNLSGLWLQPWNDGRPTIMDEETARHESYYRLPVNGPKLDLLAQRAQFRAGPGRTRMELVFATRDHGGPAGRLRRQVMIYDRAWDSLAYQAGWLDPPVSVSDRQKPGRKWAVDLVALGVDAENDSVWIGTQLADTLTNGYGSRLEFVPVRRYPATGLCVSDILLMDRIGFEPGRGALARPDGWGVPSPDRTYSSGENVPFYFEAYNLEPGEDGLIHYNVWITIEPAWKDPRLTRPALFDFKRPFRARVEARFAESAAAGDLKRMLDLDTGHLPAGLYRLKVAIDDTVAGSTATGSVVFRVIEPAVLSEKQK